ncbi:helix-turn-helix transcriptional regulator [Leifsonia sp. NPDC080035]|uniref:Helix-turn-helix transcriptional regulator n=1 Tax=Leifsonia sp. NPDC080035 TaxID=3143936 RepID=A0AAU7GBI1_9MICO
MRQPSSPAALVFGSRVRYARIALGLSQETIAELAQIHVTNYGKIERGLTNPSLTTLIRIATVLGMEVSTLTDGLGAADLPPRFDVLTAQAFIEARDRHR